MFPHLPRPAKPVDVQVAGPAPSYPLSHSQHIITHNSRTLHLQATWGSREVQRMVILFRSLCPTVTFDRSKHRGMQIVLLLSFFSALSSLFCSFCEVPQKVLSPRPISITTYSQSHSATSLSHGLLPCISSHILYRYYVITWVPWRTKGGGKTMCKARDVSSRSGPDRRAVSLEVHFIRPTTTSARVHEQRRGKGGKQLEGGKSGS